MKHWAVLFLTMVSAIAGAAESRDPLWRQVQEAEQSGLPQTGIQVLQTIIDGAVRDQAWAEATKAIGRRIALESRIEGGNPEQAITRLAQELERVPPSIQPLFHTLLGNAYWSYFRQNRWRFARRTATATAPGTDFTTWDLRRLFAEIDRHFQIALSNDAALKATPIAEFDVLLEPGTVPDTLRPTLYDFLAREALNFYQAGEQGLARPEDAFVPNSTSPLLGSRDEFVRWQLEASESETNAPTVRAIRLFQSLLRHQITYRDPGALIATDVDRLTFGLRTTAGPDKDQRYADALLALADRWSDHEVSALARQTAAHTLHRLGRSREAHRLARQANGAFPNSIWTRDCRNLIAEIEAPQIAVTTERTWNPPWPSIDVEYRNVTRIWFRAYRADWAQYLDRRLPRPERLSLKQRLEMLEREPALEWSTDLPATPDYRPRRETVPAPTTLPPGFYFMSSSHLPGFPEDDNQLSVTTVWVTQLALLTRAAQGGIEGFVLDSESGEPRPGATVEAWFLAPNGNRTALAPQTTDALGFFRLEQPRPGRGHLIRATLGPQQIALASDVWWHEGMNQQPPGERDQTIVLTDRALYRPGQTIHYKGIAFRLDDDQVRYQLRSGRDITVVFRDANHQEIARRSLKTSDLGSFSGSFTAPRDRLPGRMLIQVEGDSSFAAGFNVEEYKRPKFQVVLDPPTDAPRLNESVTWTGRALAYTGAAIDRAKVSWRVRRETRLPVWWGLFRPGPGSGSETDQEIAHGTAETAADGSFQFRFRALADPLALEADEPTFHFQIHVDITDGAGETRSAERSVPIGYAALAAELHAPEWQVADQLVPIRITTQTLDGNPLAAAGSLKIHRLEQPLLVHQGPLGGVRHQVLPMGQGRSTSAEAIDLSNPNHWRMAEVLTTQTFRTTTNGIVTNRVELPAGVFRAVLETQDRFGRKVTSQLQLRVLDPGADRLNIKIPHLLDARALEVEPGQEFLALWGTGYESGRAFVEIQHRGKTLERYWTAPGRTQQRIPVAVTEALRGGFQVSVTQVRENRLYRSSQDVEVPWKNKDLELSWESFRSQLEPGQKETWTAVIKPVRPGSAESEAAARLATEMVATLYDASLDQFLPHQWPNRFEFWPNFSGAYVQTFFSNELTPLEVFRTHKDRAHEDTNVRYRSFPPELRFENLGKVMFKTRTLSGAASAPSRGALMGTAEMAAPMAMAVADASAARGDMELFATGFGGEAAGGAAPTPSTPPDLARVSTRQNLNETAFFFPHLASDSNGVVRMSFTVPEALTEWRFLALAHDRDLRSGSLTAKAVTAKDLMVQPNPPRFLREGDDLEFTVKVLNQSDTAQSGQVRLGFAFAQDGKSADADLGNTTPDLAFSIPAKESRAFSWRIRVPDGCGVLTFKAVAATTRHSDGEEGFLPVLARRVLITESLPLPIRGPGTRTFEFTSLSNSVDSTTLRHQNLRVEMASNPAWYAVLALPYLMEYPHECAEQVFNRLYANALARHIAGSNPRIRQIFDQWRATPALDSPLEKNADLKAIALAETPWVRDAQSESEARRSVGVLFDANRLDAETERALRKLEELLLPEGAWPWFPGGPRNDFISLYLVSGFGRLRQLGVDLPMTLPLRALPRLDTWMDDRYQDLKERKLLDRLNIDASIGLYLYGRSFFMAALPLPPASQEALGYWLHQAREHWLKLDRQTQGHLALAMTRFGNAIHHDAQGTAAAIAKSLKQHSITSEELGRFWIDPAPSDGWWYRAPIETQSLMIEVFQVVTQDAAAVEECRIWLLKQKQTQGWKSTKATADAIYAILLSGPSLLASDALVQVQLANRDLTPDPRSGSRDPKSTPEPGTGFYQVRIPAQDIRPEMAAITVRKADAGIAWGAVHWQYFEDLGKIRPFAGSPLTLTKQIFVRTQTRQGAKLQPVTGPIRVGDELVVRIELRSDRDLEFVHLKDLRGSGTEPVNVVSAYKFQDGLGYYESTRDTASHFFIEYLRKGSYVFEYPLRVQHKGAYPTGTAEVQCLYAPEFNSHSESLRLRVQ
jgi:hypothetical protein